jgi:hypothetical protein
MGKAKPEQELVGLENGERKWPTPILAEASGLCVADALPRDRKTRGRYVVAHVESGLGACWYPTRDAALMGLARLTMFIDWNLDPKAICCSELHVNAARAEAMRDAVVYVT